MNTETRLMASLVGSLALVFLVFGTLWTIRMRASAGVVLMAGGVAVFLGFGYAAYRHLTWDGPD